MRITIIGGGPGGYTAAFEAARRGHAVTLVENDSLGGTCLNRGCIPTKTLRSSADALALARRLADYGLDGCPQPAPVLEALRRRKENVIGILRQGLEKTCGRLGVRLVRATGRVRSAGLVLAEGSDGQEEIVGDAVIIATGSRVLELPGLPFDHTFICSSDDALDLASIPARLLIVGGGVVGCEMACIYRALGSDVTVIEGQDRLLPMPGVDEDISTLLAREFRKQKIRLLTGRTLTGVTVADGAVAGEAVPAPFAAPAASADAAAPVPLAGDMVLVTVGRLPVTEGLGLADAGVAVDARGWVMVDEGFQTSVPGIYAVGDILGPAHIMLAHAAAAEALCVVDTLCGAAHPMRYDAVPSAIFTSPEIGLVGLDEKEAARRGKIVCGLTQMRELGKAQAMGELAGFFKIVAAADTGALLGASIVGAHASDMIAEAGLALTAGLNVRQIAATIHPHPTLTEGFAEAAAAAVRQLEA